MKYQARHSSERAAGWLLYDLQAEITDAPCPSSPLVGRWWPLKVPLLWAPRGDDPALEPASADVQTNHHSGHPSGIRVPSSSVWAHSSRHGGHQQQYPRSCWMGARIYYQATLKWVLSFPKKIFSTGIDFYCFKTNISKCDCTVHGSVKFVLSCNPETYHYRVLCEQSWAWLSCDWALNYFMENVPYNTFHLSLHLILTST